MMTWLLRSDDSFYIQAIHLPRTARGRQHRSQRTNDSSPTATDLRTEERAA